LLSEFDPNTGQHHSESVYTLNPKNKTLVRDDVYALGNKSLALAKRAFAENVDKRVNPFDGVSFEGFRPTFALIEDMAARIADDAISRS
jgi:RNA-directed DNA polymerase